MQQVESDEKLKDPTDVANAFHNLFIIITEKLNNPQIEKGDTTQFKELHFLETSPA